MSANLKINEFQVDEHDVIVGVGWSGSVPVSAGTPVAWATASGWVAGSDLDATNLGIGGRVTSPQWITANKVKAADTGDAVIGILRHDVRNVDENNVPWHAYPSKWEENGWVASGQPNAVITAGFVFVKGITGTVAAGNVVYASGGELVAASSLPSGAEAAQVGYVYGAPNANSSFALIKIKTKI